MSLSARGAGIGRTTVYEAMQHDDSIRERIEDAKETAIEHLEHEARRRAVAGSDLLLIFLLKALKPEKYRDTYRVRAETNQAADYVIDISPAPAALEA